MEQLERAKRLHDVGALTNAEFECEKDRLIRLSSDAVSEQGGSQRRLLLIGGAVVALVALALLTAHFLTAKEPRAPVAPSLTQSVLPPITTGNLPEPETRTAPVPRQTAELEPAVPPTDDPGDLCTAVALEAVAAEENPDSVLKKGAKQDSVTQYRIDADGNDFFCSHGGYCYPVTRSVGGRKVTYLRLTNCKIDTAPYGGEEDPGGEKMFGTLLLRNKVSPQDLRFADVQHALLSKTDLSGVGQSNAAYKYVHDPKSTCAALVRRILMDDQAAIARASTLETIC
jgi:hypothetical protein